MALQAVVKNNFFTYVQVVGKPELKFREHAQHATYKGMLLQFQGNMPNNNGGISFNGFAKRHLVTTEGSWSGKTATQKMEAIAKKRLPIAPSQTIQSYNAQSGKMRREKKSAKVYNEIKNDLSGSVQDKKKEIEKSVYSMNVWGADTNQCTFVLLDGLSKDDVLEAFHAGISAFETNHHPLGTNYETVDVIFGGDRVKQYVGGALQNATGNGIKVRVLKSSVVMPDCYHIYHYDGLIA